MHFSSTKWPGIWLRPWPCGRPKISPTSRPMRYFGRLTQSFALWTPTPPAMKAGSGGAGHTAKLSGGRPSWARTRARACKPAWTCGPGSWPGYCPSGKRSQSPSLPGQLRFLHGLGRGDVRQRTHPTSQFGWLICGRILAYCCTDFGGRKWS